MLNKKEDDMVKFLWGVAFVFSILSGLYAFLGILLAKSAPQEAAAAATALCVCIIPYCLARAAAGVRGGT